MEEKNLKMWQFENLKMIYKNNRMTVVKACFFIIDIK